MTRPQPFPNRITNDDMRPLIYTAHGIAFLEDLSADDQARIARLIEECDNEDLPPVVDPNDPTTWWTPAEQRQHWDELVEAVRRPLDVAARIAAARRDLDLDWAAVERVCSGPSTIKLNYAERREAFAYLVRHGMNRTDIRERLHISGRTYRDLLQRLERLSTPTAAAS